MAERIVSRYKPLFEVWMLHHYWLDYGRKIFDLIADRNRKDRVLQAYDVRPLLSLEPTAASAKALKGFGGIYRNTARGCVAAIPENIAIPDDTLFEFAVTVRDAAFCNYTALTLRPQKIYEIYNRIDDKVYRYKENVAVLSNLTGASRLEGLQKTLFLSTEFPALAASDPVESLYLSGNALRQLGGDQPGASSRQLHAQADDVPVFVHQGDVPTIVPPAGLDAPPPPRGLLLNENLPDTLFALIRLSAVRPDDGAFSFIDANGRAVTPHPVYQVRFKNRATVWRYLKKSSGTTLSEETDPLPLTHFGHPGAQQKPATGLVKAEKTGARITKLVSEIFV